MRIEITAQGTSLTVGELRAALEGVDDAARVMVEGWCIDSALVTDLEVVLSSEEAREVPDE